MLMRRRSSIIIDETGSAEAGRFLRRDELSDRGRTHDRKKGDEKVRSRAVLRDAADPSWRDFARGDGRARAHGAGAWPCARHSREPSDADPEGAARRHRGYGPPAWPLFRDIAGFLARLAEGL